LGKVHSEEIDQVNISSREAWFENGHTCKIPNFQKEKRVALQKGKQLGKLSRQLKVSLNSGKKNAAQGRPNAN